jgi:hypothetical protein
MGRTDHITVPRAFVKTGRTMELRKPRVVSGAEEREVEVEKIWL